MPSKSALVSGGVTAPALSLAENVCLALIAHEATHGWAIGALLAPDAELGRVWTLTRPLTYRAIEGLVEKRLIDRKAETEPRGRDRSILRPTKQGRLLARQWLDMPVEHLRNVRTELLIKLALRERFGLSSEPLLKAQQLAFDDAIGALTTRTGGDIVDLWRREHARAVRRFLYEALRPQTEQVAIRPVLKISARNQLQATVTSVKRGELMAGVKATLPDGQNLTATITQEAVDDLDLAIGDNVVLVIKASEVMIAKAP